MFCWGSEETLEGDIGSIIEGERAGHRITFNLNVGSLEKYRISSSSFYPSSPLLINSPRNHISINPHVVDTVHRLGYH